MNQAKLDIQAITSDLDGFGTALTFIALSAETANVVGLHAKHHTGFNDMGEAVNSLISSIAISEQFLTDAGYPVRDSNGEVSLKNHKVKAIDSTGVENTYVIREYFPDDTVGLIVCILGTYKAS